MSESHYETLGIADDADSAEVRGAFVTIARECHPDVAGTGPDVRARFVAARSAFETLSDPERRARYDRGR